MIQKYPRNINYYLLTWYIYYQIGFITQDEFPGNPFEPISLHKYLYANANPVNFIDSSGRMSMFLFASVLLLCQYYLQLPMLMCLIYIAQIQNLLNGVDGLYIFSFGQDAGAGIISAEVDSECIDGKKGSGIFLMLMTGYTRGFFLNQSICKFKIKTPGIYGSSPWTLVSPFAWIVVTRSLGFGLTLTAAIYMGMGIGTVNFDSLLVLDLILA